MFLITIPLNAFIYSSLITKALAHCASKPYPNYYIGTLNLIYNRKHMYIWLTPFRVFQMYQKHTNMYAQHQYCVRSANREHKMRPNRYMHLFLSIVWTWTTKMFVGRCIFCYQFVDDNTDATIFRFSVHQEVLPHSLLVQCRTEERQNSGSPMQSSDHYLRCRYCLGMNPIYVRADEVTLREDTVE